MSATAARDPIPGRLPADKRRAHILRQAAELFGTRGFKGTTTRDVALRVGITEAALYRYFPSKEAMYAAILDQRASAPELLEPFQPLIEAGDDRGVLTELALALLRAVVADPSLLRLLLYSGLEGHELARPFHEGRIRRMRETLASYIERRRREGAFRADLDPLAAARAFIGMVLYHLIAREIFRQRDLDQPPEQVAETFVAIFLGGVRADEGGADV
jgi:AcrR family transcriptional regulator